jgi:hypothetical protein
MRFFGRGKVEKPQKKEKHIRDAEVIEPGWSILKISVAVFIVIAGIVAFFYFNKSARDMFLPTSVTHMQVKGVSTEKVATNSSRLSPKSVQDKINEIKKEIQNINVVDVTTHSPQAQKVMNDLKSLEGVPGTQAKNVCESICKGL